MKWIKRVLLFILFLVVVFVVFVQFAPPKTYNIELPEVTISSDSATIARGEYLIFGPAHCYGCHSMEKDSVAIRNAEKVALGGGKYFDTPLGKIYIPNITPDETGIKNISDGQIARAMRYAVNHNNNVMIPAMPFTHMSEVDVNAIISYLRAQKPVHNEVPKTNYTFMGKALTRFMLRPYKKTAEIPLNVEPGLTVEYGKYLALSVANCKGCHTTFNMQKMEFDGDLLAGGGLMDEGGEYVFFPPNLTPHPESGHISKWSEEQFITRFKSGPAFKGTPMPWDAFGKMSEVDLKAIYRYLQTLDPVDNNPGPLVQLKEDVKD